jgi:hypothetical protein
LRWRATAIRWGIADRCRKSGFVSQRYIRLVDMTGYRIDQINRVAGIEEPLRMDAGCATDVEDAKRCTQ